MRELAAQLYALVVSTMTGNELQMAVHNLVKITKDNHVRSALSLLSADVVSAFYLFIYFYFICSSSESRDPARRRAGPGLHGGTLHEQEESGHVR